jgi:hypothetical protein
MPLFFYLYRIGFSTFLPAGATARLGMARNSKQVLYKKGSG